MIWAFFSFFLFISFFESDSQNFKYCLVAASNNISIGYILSAIKKLLSSSHLLCCDVCVWIHVCAPVYRCIYTFMFMHVEARAQYLVGVFLSWSPSHCLRQGLSMNLDLNDLPRLAGTQASGTLLSDSTKNRDYKCVAPHAMFHIEAGGLNSSSHTCTSRIDHLPASGFRSFIE